MNPFSQKSIEILEKSPLYFQLNHLTNNIIRVKPLLIILRILRNLKNKFVNSKILSLMEKIFSSHSSPTFMVRNHNEIRKARTVINYRQINHLTQVDGYFILSDRKLPSINNDDYFSKFDTKSGFDKLSFKTTNPKKLVHLVVQSGNT